MHQPTAYNGILGRTDGDLLSQARQTLPPADAAPDVTVTRLIDAGWAGRVRVTFERRELRHRKTRYWAWFATRADAEP